MYLCSSLCVMFTCRCSSDLVSPLQHHPWKTPPANMLLDVISHQTSRCINAAFFVFALPVVCVDLNLMHETAQEKAFVEQSGQQQMKMSINALRYFIYNIFLLTLVAVSASRSGEPAVLLEEACLILWSREFLKEVLPRFYSPFLFFSLSNLCVLLCWRYCSSGELWSYSQSTRGLEKKNRCE